MRGQGLQGQQQQAEQQADKKRRIIEESEKILKKWILKTLKSCTFLWMLTGICYTTTRTKKGDFKPPQFYIITLNKMEDLKINEFERLDSVDAGDLITQTDEELEKLIQEQAKKGEEGQNSQKN